jgi:hypothetical protein
MRFQYQDTLKSSAITSIMTTVTLPKLAGIRITKLKSTYKICFLCHEAQLICRLGCNLD